MTYQTDLLEALQDYGFILGTDLLPYAGWKTRGKEFFNPKGSVNHHTAGARIGVLPSLEVLLNGRSDVPGPLCNGALDRLARIHLIAAGKANHAGAGSWHGVSGNSNMFGLEVEHVGTTAEPVSADMWDAMYRWHAACCDVGGFDTAMVCQHYEWTDRKIDFVEEITDEVRFRANVHRIRFEKDDDMSAADVEKITDHIDAKLAPIGMRVAVMTEALTGPFALEFVNKDGKAVPRGTPGAKLCYRWVRWINEDVKAGRQSEEDVAELAVTLEEIAADLKELAASGETDPLEG